VEVDATTNRHARHSLQITHLHVLYLTVVIVGGQLVTTHDARDISLPVIGLHVLFLFISSTLPQCFHKHFDFDFN